MISAGTAYEGLVDRGRLQAGQTVLSTAAAGGVGGVDLLLDGAGGQTRDQAIGAVRDGGRAVFVVLQDGAARLERGITGKAFAAHVDRQRLDALRGPVEVGQLRPQVEAAHPSHVCRAADADSRGRARNAERVTLTENRFISLAL